MSECKICSCEFDDDLCDCPACNADKKERKEREQRKKEKCEEDRKEKEKKKFDICDDKDDKKKDSDEHFSYDVIREIADFLLKNIKIKPKIAIICGSGLQNLAEGITDSEVFPYDKIPNFPVSTVAGHAGKLVFGNLQGVPVMVMLGRFHHYEGYPLVKCSMPIRVMKLMGIENLIATNAAGGINPNFKVGHVMFIRDHLNIMGFAGNSPLRGTNDEKFGPRFPSLNNAYNSDLIKMAKEIGKSLGMESEMHEGVYACLGGPTYETVAELRALRCLGVDAVGMSTVNEVITARHCDITVLAFSLITNECIMEYDTDKKPNHEEVLAAGKAAEKKCGQIVGTLVKEIIAKKQKR